MDEELGDIPSVTIETKKQTIVEHSNKTMYTGYGDMNGAIPRNRNGD